MRKIFNLVKHPLFAGSFIMIFGSNAVSFLNYLYHFVMGRLLGPAAYGELAAIISLIGLLGIIPGSLSLVVIKYVSSAKDEKVISALINWLRTKIFLASFIFALIIFISSPVISSFLHINNTFYLIFVSVSFLFSIQALFNRSILQGLLKFKETVISILMENGIKLISSIVLVYLGFQVGGAIVGFVVSVVLGWYITNSYLRHYKKQTDINIDLKQILLFVIPVLVQSVATTSLYSSDVILIKHFFSSYDSGIYASLSTLGKIIFFGTSPISSVMFPLVSKKSARGENYRKIFIYSFITTILLSVSILLIFAFFPQIAIKLLYGKLYLAAANLLIWFGIAMTLFTLSSLLINYGLSLGRTSIVILPLIAALAQILLIWFFHQSLFHVILVSIIVNALLLLSLLVYSMYRRSLK